MRRAHEMGKTATRWNSAKRATRHKDVIVVPICGDLEWCGHGFACRRCNKQYFQTTIEDFAVVTPRGPIDYRFA